MYSRHRRSASCIVLFAAVAFTALWSGHGRADAPQGRYTISNGIVYDTKTKLFWEQVVSPATFDWTGAKTYCAMLNHDGMGWRLPSMKELQTIVDEKRYGAAIDPTAFPNTPSEQFWTSSASAIYSSWAWYVAFNDGKTYHDGQASTYRARCVR